MIPDSGGDPGEHAELAEDLRELAVKLSLLTNVERTAVLHMANGGSYDDSPLSSPKAVDNALQRAKVKLARPVAPASRRERGVLLIDRSVHPSRRDAIRAAGRVHPGCKVIELHKRKVRAGRVVSPQGRSAADGSLGRPVWAVEIETAA